jgi:methionyl-tRNA synthetase
MSRRILVTSALPYANGHIHIGHMVEYIQTDIWVRFQKLRGHECIYLCADDTHGTAIMNRARLEGRSEEDLIATMQQSHTSDFGDFLVKFDNYGSTHSKENEELCGRIWKSLEDAGLIREQDVEQLFDPEANVFLADRWVKGTCPNCKSADQYGDNCEVCGATYSATEVINPVSTLSGATPVVKSAPHFFVDIEKMHAFLEEWTQRSGALQGETANHLRESFLGEPLRSWDVSRPAPYFGFTIPNTNGEHYWYVWFDAPIGYIASTWQWCKNNGQELSTWWEDPATEIHHFIGKDITYFHTLFWPAMLKAAGMNLPKRVHIHGFLTVNGRKMAKRDGTFIRARTYLNHLEPQYLRYYYAYKLGDGADDLDLNFAEFVERVDGDLVGKVVNLASRTAKFASKTGLSQEYPEDGGLFAQAAAAGEEIAAAYEIGEYSKAMRQIMVLADHANRFVEHQEPWKLAKDPEQAGRLQDVCTIALNLFRQIAIYLAPVLPKMAEQTGELLGEPIQSWNQAQTPLVGTAVGKFAHMMQRVDVKKVEKMIEESKEEHAQSQPGQPADVSSANVPAGGDTAQYLEAEPLAAECTIDDFTKVDLRVARVISAEAVPEARKLMKLRVSLGGDNERTIFAGIKSAYTPEQLTGSLVVIVANLAPRQMKFGLSEGMVVAAGAGGQEIFVLRTDEGAKPGMRVH